MNPLILLFFCCQSPLAPSQRSTLHTSFELGNFIIYAQCSVFTSDDETRAPRAQRRGPNVSISPQHKQLAKRLLVCVLSLSLSHSLSVNLPHPLCRREMNMSSMSLDFCLVNTIGAKHCLPVCMAGQQPAPSLAQLSRGAKLTLLPF